MDTTEWLDKIGNTLGDARKGLDRRGFLIVLAYTKVFTARMLELETAEMDKHAVAEIVKLIEQGVDIHIREQLRTVGIEL